MTAQTRTVKVDELRARGAGASQTGARSHGPALSFQPWSPPPPAHLGPFVPASACLFFFLAIILKTIPETEGTN